MWVLNITKIWEGPNTYSSLIELVKSEYWETNRYSFKIGDKVVVANDFDTTKNPKLVANGKVPAKIVDTNDTYAKVKFKNKIKVLNLL